MPSLPVLNSAPQLPGRQPSDATANSVSAMKAAASRSGNDGHPASDAPDTQPFAILLARQIGAMDLSAGEFAAVAADGPAAEGSETNPQDAAVDLAASDPAIAALLSVPQEPRPSRAGAERAATDEPPAAERAASRPAPNAGRAATVRAEPPLNAPATSAGQEFADLLAERQTASLQSSGGKTAEQQVAALASSAAEPAPALAPATAAGAAPRASGPAQMIGTPLGSRTWANDFSQQITWMSAQHSQTASLHLNPANLGPLDVVLKITDNQATALFTSPHGAVREAVENALPKLREMLADNGIMLGEATVSDQPPRDRGETGGTNQGYGSDRRGADADETADPAHALLPEGARPASRQHDGMVDTFA